MNQSDHQIIMNMLVELVGDDAVLVAAMISGAMTIDTDRLRDAVVEIDRQQAIGPIINPTVCRGEWFDASDNWKTCLDAIRQMATTIQRAQRRSAKQGSRAEGDS